MIARAQPFLPRRELQAIGGRLLDPWTDNAEGLLQRAVDNEAVPADVIERQSNKYGGFAAVAKSLAKDPAMLALILGDQRDEIDPETRDYVASYVADELARRSAFLSDQAATLARSAARDDDQAISIQEYEIETCPGGLTATQVAKILGRVKVDENLLRLFAARNPGKRCVQTSSRRWG